MTLPDMHPYHGRATTLKRAMTDDTKEATQAKRLTFTLLTAGAFLLIASLAAVVRGTIRNDDPRPRGRAD